MTKGGKKGKETKVDSERAARRLTVAELNAGCDRGMFTRETLEGWGVSWPPPPQWQDALLAGRPMPTRAEDGSWKNTAHDA